MRSPLDKSISVPSIVILSTMTPALAVIVPGAVKLPDSLADVTELSAGVLTATVDHTIISILAPLAGAVSKVNVVPETEYVFLNWYTPLMYAIVVFSVTGVELKVNPVVEPSPEKLFTLALANVKSSVNDRLPLPSVFNNWPDEPSAAGRTQIWSALNAGASNPT